MARTSGTFGSVEQLPGGHYRARYTGPDGRRYKAPTTFLNKTDARGWLSIQQADIIRKAWTPPEATCNLDKRLTLRTYAARWLEERRVRGEPLKVRTRKHYQWLLDEHIYPTFGSMPVAALTASDVRAWHTKMGKAMIFVEQALHRYWIAIRSHTEKCLQRVDGSPSNLT